VIIFVVYVNYLYFSRKMKKDKKKKSNNSKRNKPSYYQELLKEYWIEIKYNKLYYSSILVIALFAFFSLYFQYTYEKSQRQNRQEDSGVLCMLFKLDYYDILGLDSSADLAMINRKYRELAKIW
jgi:hypothetical protein